MKDTKRYNALFQGRSKDVTLRVTKALLGALSSDLARGVVSILETDDHTDILNLEVNPHEYEDAEAFACDYLAASILSKYPYLSVCVDREKVALAKFMAAEQTCESANNRLRESYAGGTNHHRWLSEVFYIAQRKIADLLPDFSWDSARNYMGFGPGASLSLNRTHGDAYYKFGNLMPTVTAGCAGLAEWVISTTPAWLSHVDSNQSAFELHVVRGNRVTTVPKNAKADRVIAIEPDMNMYVQRGIGGLIRRALRHVGVDLNSQEKNQIYARDGSIDGSLATLDLKAASDSVCCELVEALLPPDWVDAIMSCRSPSGELPDGTVVTYQKVSSMGNGFTFELESLLFWALSSAVMISRGEKDRRLAVYGDDLIVPVAVVSDLVTVLNFCGFDINPEKSFWSSQFRESCGKHYFAGVDCTPIYVRERIDSPERLFWWCNTIRRFAARDQLYGCDSTYKAAWDMGIEALPRSLRSPSVPLYVDHVQFADTAIGGDFDEVRPRFNRAVFEYEAEGWVRVFKNKPGHGVPYLLKVLSRMPEETTPEDLLSLVWEKLPYRIGFSTEMVKWLAEHTVREYRDRPVSKVGSDSLHGVSSQRWVYRNVKTCVPQWGNVGPWL